jgi:hypothetical protein
MAERRRPRLDEVPVPDATAAETRARAVVAAAFARREPVRRGRRRRPALLVALVVAALAGATLTPPGQAIGGWLRDAVRAPAPVGPAPPAAAFPGPGRLLVTAAGRASIVDGHGQRRSLGRADDAQWSPFGRFVSLTTTAGLRVVTPTGAPRWSLERPGIRDVRWSPLGFRIAYVHGSTLRLVAGDGTADQVLARGVGAAPPAWRPRPRGAHVLAYVDGAGRVRVVRTDGGGILPPRASPTTLAVSAPGEPARGLAWSADGRRLVVLGATAVRVLDARARAVGRPLPLDAVTPRSVVAAPRGPLVAVVAGTGEGGRALVLDAARPGRGLRLVYAGRRPVLDAAFAPDGAGLLVTTSDGDDWLFVGLGARAGLRSSSGALARFGTTPGGPPRVRGWCCAP